MSSVAITARPTVPTVARRSAYRTRRARGRAERPASPPSRPGVTSRGTTRSGAAGTRVVSRSVSTPSRPTDSSTPVVSSSGEGVSQGFSRQSTRASVRPSRRARDGPSTRRPSSRSDSGRPSVGGYNDGRAFGVRRVMDCCPVLSFRVSKFPLRGRTGGRDS